MKELNSYVVWTAVITPMNADSSVDYESLGTLLKEQEETDNGIFILGSTGEGLNLDLPERKAILDFARQLNLQVPLLTGVGGSNLHEQLAWVEYLNTLNLDGYVLLTPLYAKPGVHGQYGWFKALLEAAQKPCMLYNIPGRTAKKLEFETVKMLRDHPRFWAMKEASASEADFAQYKDTAPDIHLLSGDDISLPAFSALGAKGVVSVASNVWPKAVQEVTRQCLDGNFKDVELWQEVIHALFSASNPIPLKALLHDLGRIKTPELRLPLSSQDLPDIAVLREANSRIEDWYSRL